MGFGRGKGFTAKKPEVKGTIGAPAIDREYNMGIATFHRTLIEGSNPASFNGHVTKVRFHAKATLLGHIEVGTFYTTDGDTFSSRDSVWLARPNEGLNIYTVDGQYGLPITVEVRVGDYIGVRMPKDDNGIAMDYDASWVNDFWRSLAESTFPYTDYAFNNLGKRLISLEGDIT